MKINGTIFSKPQQDQLKRGIGAELDKVFAKVDDVDKRMLNYMGDWVTGNEYHENDVVTWGADGHLYEVIKEHTSSSTIDPSNTEYYKAMTATKFISRTYNAPFTASMLEEIGEIFNKQESGKRVICFSGAIMLRPYRALQPSMYAVYDNGGIGGNFNGIIVDCYYVFNNTMQGKRITITESETPVTITNIAAPPILKILEEV